MNQIKDLERRKKIVSKLRMIDDIFFQKMFEDRAACEEILRVCMEDPVLEVLEVVPQKELKNLQGRSVKLDAYCRLGDGRLVDVEVQRADDDDHFRRVRYNGACLTVNITERGIQFRDVPDVCVIYITEFDVFNGGHTMYHVNKVVQETGEMIQDGQQEICLNAKVDDGTIQAALMKNFMLEEVADERFPEVSRRFQALKHDEEEVTHMCRELQEYYAEGRQEGRQEGRMAEKKENALELYRMGMPVEQIAKVVKMSVKIVSQWLNPQPMQ